MLIFYSISYFQPLVLPAIAEKWLPFLFVHRLMASGPFHFCTYVESEAIQRVFSSVCTDLVCERFLAACEPLALWFAVAFHLRAVANLVPVVGEGSVILRARYRVLPRDGSVRTTKL